MKLILKYLPFCLVLVFFIGIKFWYKNARTADVEFILRPTNFLIELLTSSQAIYEPQRGFFHASWNIVIEKSCSGFNFMLICFIMFTFFCLPKIKNVTQQLIALPILLLIAWLLTVFVNASRILLALKTKNMYFSNLSSASFHEIQGIFVYLTYLIIFHLIMLYVHQKYIFSSLNKNKNA